MFSWFFGATYLAYVITRFLDYKRLQVREHKYSMTSILLVCHVCILFPLSFNVWHILPGAENIKGRKHYINIYTYLVHISPFGALI
jgi:hypothetical protein